MFEGEKNSIFWIGLIIFALACIEVFSVVWFMAVMYSSYLNMELQMKVATPFIIGGAVFVLVGLYLTKSGVKKKEGEPSHCTRDLHNLYAYRSCQILSTDVASRFIFPVCHRFHRLFTSTRAAMMPITIATTTTT